METAEKPEEVKTWRQMAKELPVLKRESKKVEPVIPAGVMASLEMLVGYERLSIADEDPRIQAAKLLRQKKTRELLAAKAGMEIGADYGDPDHTGFSEDDVPPGFLAMLEVLPLWGGLVVYHPDRLTRHPAIAERLIRVYKDNPHLKFFCPDESIDLTTDEGRQNFRDAIGRAHRESLSTRRRELDTHKLLRETGAPSGKRGYGVGVKRDDGRYDQSKLNEPECAVIRKMVADILGGRTCKSIADQLNVEGVRTAQGSYWTHNGVARMLRNPRLAGWRTVRQGEKAVVALSEVTKEPIKAIHPEIIDQDTFDRLQVALAARTRRAINAENRSSGTLSSLGMCGVCWSTLHYAGPELKCSKNGCVTIVAKPVEREIVRQCLDRWAAPLEATETPDAPFPGQARLDELEAKVEETMALFHADLLTPAELAKALGPGRVELAELEAERRRWLAQTAKAMASEADPVARWRASFESKDDGLAIRRRMLRSTLEAFIVGRAERARDGQGRHVIDLDRVHLVWA